MRRAFVVERRKKQKFHKFHTLCCVSCAINMIASVGRLSFVFCCRSLSDVSWWCCEWAELSHWAHDTTCHPSTAQFTLTFNFSSFDQVHTVNIKFALKIAASWLMGECVLCSEIRYILFSYIFLLSECANQPQNSMTITIMLSTSSSVLILLGQVNKLFDFAKTKKLSRIVQKHTHNVLFQIESRAKIQLIAINSIA